MDNLSNNNFIFKVFGDKWALPEPGNPLIILITKGDTEIGFASSLIEKKSVQKNDILDCSHP